jgi:hypothetical protein
MAYYVLHVAYYGPYLACCVLHVTYYDQYIAYYVLHVAYYGQYTAYYVLHVAYYDQHMAYYALHTAIMTNIRSIMFYTWHTMTNTWPITFYIRLAVITYDFLCLQLPVPTLLSPIRGVLWPISSLLWPISSLLLPAYGVTASVCSIMVLPAPKDGRVENVVNWSRIFREGLRKTITSSEYSAVNCNPIWDCCEQITPIVWISVTLSFCFRDVAYCSEYCSWYEFWLNYRLPSLGLIGFRQLLQPNAVIKLGINHRLMFFVVHRSQGISWPFGD